MGHTSLPVPASGIELFSLVGMSSQPPVGHRMEVGDYVGLTMGGKGELEISSGV